MTVDLVKVKEAPSQIIQPEQPNRLLFANLEEVLQLDKVRAARHDARTFCPIHDQVLVILCEPEEETPSGLIVVPGSAQERPCEGIVIAVGRGRFDHNGVFIEMQVRVNDRVLFGRYAGKDWEIRGRKCRLLIEPQIEGIIR